MSATGDKVFAGSIPQLYDEYLVPLIFEPYAADLAARLRSRPATRLLEIAAGTGAVTRRLALELPPSVAIVASDLNQAMLDRAQAVGTQRPVTWKQADAMALPFGEREFDIVACQFGAMFFPDKARAFAEARRVLKPGGLFLFNVWDRIADNEFADTVTNAVAEMFPEDPPGFLARTPHGYCDPQAISRDLGNGGFSAGPRFSTVTHRSRAPSARLPAMAYCEGTPLRNEIEGRRPGSLREATDLAARALETRFGKGPIDGRIQALVVEVTA
jgi:SAM-dependent methyltransferase